jgi:four helix bundle protein
MAGARSFEELDAWKLSVELRDRVLRVSACEVVWRDRSFREQIRDAAASAPRNLAEGFGAFKPREFARFTRIARRSLMETRSHLRDAHTRRYLQNGDSEELITLCNRALGATTGLLKTWTAAKAGHPPAWDTETEL